MHRIEISLRGDLPDSRGLGLAKDIQDLGIKTVADVHVVDVYWLNADLTADELDSICKNLLADNITQEYWYGELPRDRNEAGTDYHAVEVTYNPGVTDPVEETVMKALTDMSVGGVSGVKTAKRYLFTGQLDAEELDIIYSRLLVNPIIQHVVKPGSPIFHENPRYDFKLQHVDIMDSRNAENVKRQFGFSSEEFQAIAGYFGEIGRNPTDAEMETLAQTWSEHCVHKTFKGKIKLDSEIYDNLLKSTIIKVTRELDKPWCLSVFVDNAGVIDFDGRWALCFKVETHNHPSAVEPYGGAATGLGGVVRDPLGTGLGARPILNTDVFCFAPPDYSYEKLPRGVLHPRRVFKGVRAGVADYGNRLGIPTLNGAILFDDRFVANPLVFCGTLGIMPGSMAESGKQRAGDLVVVIGGRTGRDGIHGVTFASEQLTEESSDVSYTSVQIGNPIVEKKLIDVLLQARDRGLYVRITDCGGGGLSSAVGEMAAETGVRVYLDRIPLKYAGLSYSEIWISESQERMVLAVPPDRVDELISLLSGEDVEATVIGEFTNDRCLKLFYAGDMVCDLSMEFLHEGLPQLDSGAVWVKPEYPEPEFDQPVDLSQALLEVLGSWNVCSKEWVIRQYDHEVQGGSVLKPLVGKDSDAPGDAAIIRPVLDSEMGVIVACGINPKYADIDAYWMAASVIDEALRQIVAVGGNLERVALLDNFCWGNTARPDVMGALVRAAQACYDMAKVYETPFISGKDSLNNEFEMGGESISIPHTLLISAVGLMADVNRAVSMDFKRAGDVIYIVGATRNELGGSEYFRTRGYTGNSVPKVYPHESKKIMDTLSMATERGLVKACHDCSDGGIGVAIAEMAFGGGLGAEVRIDSVPLGEDMDRDDHILFAESNSRFLIEVEPGSEAEFKRIMGDIDSLSKIGVVTASEILKVYGLSGEEIIARSLADLKKAWQQPIKW